MCVQRADVQIGTAMPHCVPTIESFIQQQNLGTAHYALAVVLALTNLQPTIRITHCIETA